MRPPESAGGDTATPIAASSDGSRHIRLGRSQIVILAMLVAMVAVVAAIGYLSSHRVSEQTDALGAHLSRVSSDVVAYERQVLSYALVVERWNRGEASEAEVELERGLVERQRRILTDDAVHTPVLGEALARLGEDLVAVDLAVVDIRNGSITVGPAELAALVDEMVLSAKRTYDVTEETNAALVAELESGLRGARHTLWVVAGLIILLLILLVVSVRRMLIGNYEAASLLLSREHEAFRAAQAERAHVEHRYREVVDQVSDVVFRCDRTGRWTLLNQAWATLTGVPVEDAIGQPAIDAFHPADRERVTEAFDRLSNGVVSSVTEQVRLVTALGGQRVVLLSARAPRESPTGHLAGTLNDLTARVRAERLSDVQNEVLELVALDKPVQSVLDRIVELVAELLPGTTVRFVTGDQRPSRDAVGSIPLSDLARGESVGSLEWVYEPDAVPARDLASILQMASRLGALAIDRQRAADRMVHQATHDDLTGLPNRVMFVDRLVTAARRAERNGTLLAVMFLDIDRFKVVNDSLGHKAGDRLLVHLAGRLVDNLRADDTVARFGGDEFIILLEGIEEPDEVESLADQILRVVEGPVDLGTHVPHVTASIGIVIGDGSSDPDEMIRNADVAMYRAKQAGRGCYEVFDAEMQEWTARRHETEQALRRAVVNDELEVWYQPVIELGTARVKGFEALVRWRRPGLGLILPSDFVELAEDLGMIHQIGMHVLEQAARQALEWRCVSPDMVVSVNVSGRELARADYVASVSSVLDRVGAPPDAVILEITESVLVENTHAIGESMVALRELGVRVAIDDFGTGYSSLQYLRRLPADVLKIDRAFVSGNPTQTLDETIIASVTDLGHALGLEVVAEGIETAEQLETLVAMGVDTGQGYLFGRPAPPAEAGNYLDGHPLDIDEPVPSLPQ